MKILVTCPCGSEFETTTQRQEAGRGKYCSKKCMYGHRKRPKGLRYKIKRHNPSWFSLGHTPWNKGKQQPQTWSPDAGYDAIHEWVERWAWNPGCCQFCFSTENLEWSNVSGEYLRRKDDWQRLCKKCHCRYDYEKFGARRVFYE